VTGLLEFVSFRAIQLLATANNTDNNYVWLCLLCDSVESLVPDAPGRMEAGHVPVILLGCGAEVAKLTV
jgi:hypothetical protein